MLFQLIDMRTYIYKRTCNALDLLYRVMNKSMLSKCITSCEQWSGERKKELGFQLSRAWEEPLCLSLVVASSYFSYYNIRQYNIIILQYDINKRQDEDNLVISPKNVDQLCNVIVHII